VNWTFKILAGAALSLAFMTATLAITITGAGATFPFPVYAKWAALYRDVSGVGINYQSIGSGGGIAQIKARTIAFGASDKPLTQKELRAASLVQFPTVIGGVVPVVHIRGIKPGQLLLDGSVLAGIYQGKISRWDDPAIRKLNPHLALPPQAIAVVHRSDGSGTTFVFAAYLARVSPEWRKSVGVDTAIDWPVGLGAKGNEGVAGNVTQIAGSIGYVEYAYAKQNHLTYAALLNKAGQKVEPRPEAFRAAAANADWAGSAKNGFYILLVDQPGAQSWPVTATTYILIYRRPPDRAATAATITFFKWALEKGQEAAISLDYVPLPPNAVSVIESSWKGLPGM
jgi:phosphate transport system substrate-binding protein